MNKPDSLRDLLLQAVPGLRKNPERRLMFIDQGKVRCTAAASLSFEYSYTLQMISDRHLASTAMIFKHYAKWISEDGPDVVGLLNQALRLT